MSAFYCMAYPDHVEILTDGAIYEDDGTLVDIRSKVWTSNQIPMAVTGRGTGSVVEGLAKAFLIFGALGSFDKAMECIHETVMKLRNAEFPEDNNFEIVVAGVSEASGPKAFYLASIDAYDQGIEPFKIYDAGHEIGGGNPLEAAEVAGLDATGGLAAVAVPLFEAMRRKAGPNPTRPDLPHIYGIGGHIDHTVVTAEGCTTSRLHEWPDVVGRKIDPGTPLVMASAC